MAELPKDYPLTEAEQKRLLACLHDLWAQAAPDPRTGQRYQNYDEVMWRNLSCRVRELEAHKHVPWAKVQDLLRRLRSKTRCHPSVLGSRTQWEDLERLLHKRWFGDPANPEAPPESMNVIDGEQREQILEALAELRKAKMERALDCVALPLGRKHRKMARAVLESGLDSDSEREQLDACVEALNQLRAIDYKMGGVREAISILQGLVPLVRRAETEEERMKVKRERFHHAYGGRPRLSGQESFDAGQVTWCPLPDLFTLFGLGGDPAPDPSHLGNRLSQESVRGLLRHCKTVGPLNFLETQTEEEIREIVQPDLPEGLEIDKIRRLPNGNAIAYFKEEKHGCDDDEGEGEGEEGANSSGGDVCRSEVAEDGWADER